MLKIGEVAAIYDISNRTLRYWEEAGILKSCRMDNGYRYYDNVNIMRIKQIMLLRKLRLPIQDIQRIFVSGELSAAIDALTRHLDETKHEVEELNALGVILERLIRIMKSQQSLTGVLEYLDIPDNAVILEFKNALLKTLSGKESAMSKNVTYNTIGDVRIVSLPKMIVASYCAISETPENDCWKVMNKLIMDYYLYEKPGFRHFGFNNPNPEPGKTEYGYEMWVVVPENFEVPEPFLRKEFSGGLYAALPAYMPVIGERWGQLYEWLQTNETYELDWQKEKMRNELEECIDYFMFNSNETEESDKQLDLLAPIRRIYNKKEEKQSFVNEITYDLEHKRVILPQITLGGCVFEQKENTLLWKKHVPWYKLAQAIYKSGKNCMQHIVAGNNTFTLVYGETSTQIPFYLSGKQGSVTNVFGAVEISAPFESYPDGLHERVLSSREYLLFSVWITPEKATTKGLPSINLYNAAAEYVLKYNCKVDLNYCLEREYRKDGRKVDKLELYIPLVE